MEYHTSFILFVILFAFVFEFINGFHDASNSIATIVTTGVLTPRQAVMWAAFFNFIAFLLFDLMVAQTIGSGLIDTSLVDARFIFSALLGAIFWNMVTWYYGLPSSSSHALIGGLVGAALAKGGFASLKMGGLSKVALGIVVAPVLGLVVGFLCTYGLRWLLQSKNEAQVNTLSKRLQLVSSALLSVTHGGNDAQKTMGIIAILLFTSHWIGDRFYVPFWVVISCHAVIAAGTLVGGWRIVHTLGTQITSLNPIKGCAAETGAALIIYAATECGVPVSTTHTVTGSIAGVGLVSGVDGTHWKVIRKIFFSWVLTIPASAIVAAAIMLPR
ncbi:MAG: inorganic phosphate transporter [Legionellales bacterium]